MKIRTVSVKQTAAEPFSPFLEGQEIEMLGAPGMFVIGAIANAGQGEFAAGVLVFRVGTADVRLTKLVTADIPEAVEDALFAEEMGDALQPEDGAAGLQPEERADTLLSDGAGALIPETDDLKGAEISGPMKQIEEALAKAFITVCSSARIGQVRLAVADQAAKARLEAYFAGELLIVDEAAGGDKRYRFRWIGYSDDLLSYDELAPMSLLERTFLPGALMGVMTAGERPCGIVIATQEEETYVVEWLYVSPGFRGKGIGGELLKKMGQHSRKKGYRELAVCLSKAFESRMEGDVEAYVKGHGFTEEEKHLPEYACRLSELIDAVLPQHGEPGSEEGGRGTGKETQPGEPGSVEGADPEMQLLVESLAEAEERTIDMIREFLEKSRGRKAPLAAEKLFGQADRRLSVVAVRRGKPAGIILVHKGLTGVYPYYMHSQNTQDAHVLVREALWRAARCLSPEAKVNVRCIRFSSDRVMQKYSPPAACFPVRYLLAILPK